MSNLRIFCGVVAVLALFSGSTVNAKQQSSSPPEPAVLEQLYGDGIDFDVFLANADQRKELWQTNWLKSEPSDDWISRARSLAGNYRLLAVTVDACSDSVNTIPYIAGLVKHVDQLELQIVNPRIGKVIMDTYRTPDGRGATPTVVILDENFGVAGVWVERPLPLQDWWISNPKISVRNKVQRKQSWYDWDAGAHTIREIVELLEAADVNSGR